MEDMEVTPQGSTTCPHVPVRLPLEELNGSLLRAPRDAGLAYFGTAAGADLGHLASIKTKGTAKGTAKGRPRLKPKLKSKDFAPHRSPQGFHWNFPWVFTTCFHELFSPILW